MKRGSITVFAALSFMLVASFIFALLEAGRVCVLNTYADMTSELGVESVCAEYQTGLWQNYRLLALDGAYGGETFSADYAAAVLAARIRKNTEWENASRPMKLSLSSADVRAYQLLTDGEGDVFLNHVADYMKKNLPVETARLLRERYEGAGALANRQESKEQVEEAQTVIEEARREEAAKREQESEQQPVYEAPEIEENPLEVVLSFKQKALLDVVTEGSGNVSGSRVKESEMIERRIRKQGTMKEQSDTDWYAKVLALEYLDRYFTDYVDAEPNHALSYELEYVLCGREADRDNLEKVAERLLLMREAANVTHILGDGEKREASLGIAGALAGFTGNPAVIKVVQIGVVAAWAYAESVLDVRALLAGKRIALLKTKEQWMTGLGHLSEALWDTARAKECENGLSYQDYLKGFLFLMESKKLAYRMMDVMEWNIRRLPAAAELQDGSYDL